MTKKQDTGFWK